MPRPLPAHLASAMLLWLSSRAGLTSLSGALPGSKPPGDMTQSAPAKAAPGKTYRVGCRRSPPKSKRSVLIGSHRRSIASSASRRGVSSGARILSPSSLRASRIAGTRTVAAERGAAARLWAVRQGRSGGADRASLINRYTILDLLRERSFVRHLAAEGLRPLVLDWGEPAPRSAISR